MLLFPDTVRPIAYQWRYLFATIVSQNPESGRKVTNIARPYDLLAATLQFPIRPFTDYTGLAAFCRAVRGQGTIFLFRDFNGGGNPLVARWGGAVTRLATSDGSTLTYALPFGGKFGPYVVYDNGVAMTPTTDYSITANGGADGNDLLTFVAGHQPAAGHVVAFSIAIPVYVGTSDGSTLVYDLPFQHGTGYEIYDNDAVMDFGIDYSIGAGTGNTGRDKLTFAPGHAPAAGHDITTTVTTGRLSIPVRLADDSFAGQTFSTGNIQPSLTIVQDLG